MLISLVQSSSASSFPSKTCNTNFKNLTSATNLLPKTFIPGGFGTRDTTLLSCPSIGIRLAQRKCGRHYNGPSLNSIQYKMSNSVDHSVCVEGVRVENRNILHCKQINLSRRLLLISFTSTLFPTLSSSGKTKVKSPYDEKRLLEQNRRRQKDNNAPEDFPNFVREGFEVKVLTSDKYKKRGSGLIYWDIEDGKGDCPKAGQQVTFHYIGYNESGRRIDSTYLQGSPAKIRLGNNALVPGFEEGILDMRPGGRRRIIIPPELGPPVGPSTFFSAKQFEVFDVELLSIQNCERRTIAFYSDVVCN